jgi:tetratricopeptide (TPR) repeat protein
MLDQLRRLYQAAGSPSMTQLEHHANLAGRKVSRVAMWELLNGKRRPRLPTVEAFVVACCGYARSRRIRLTAEEADLEVWRIRYRTAYPSPAMAGSSAGGAVVPRQLPNVARLVARGAEIAALNDLRRQSSSAGPADAGPILTITGTAGVGKTTLAVGWAREIAADFPDGQLYLDLGGFGGADPTSPDEALRALLDAFDVDPARIPASRAARSALFRSLVVDRRVLIVLDNAREADHVRPLLPASPGSVTIVTSRNDLGSLVALEGARALTLDLLTETQARQLLAQRLGHTRVTAESQAVDRIIRCCAYLPLALVIVAARATTEPTVSLEMLADELEWLGSRLNALSVADGIAADVRSVLYSSYRGLEPAGAYLFRLLGVHPGPDIDAEAAARLIDSTTERALEVLSELLAASLVSEREPHRYQLHDLLRTYAIELTHHDDPTAIRLAAGRVVDHYLSRAAAADHLLDPVRDSRVRLVEYEPEQPAFADVTQAWDWLRSEHRVLVGVVEVAVRSGLDGQAWQLAWTLSTFLDRAGHWSDWVTVTTTALHAAERLGHQAGQAVAHRVLGHALFGLDRISEAVEHLETALGLFQAVGDGISEAATHNSLGGICDHVGDRAMALHHAEQAMRLFEAAGDHIGHAHALNSVGWCHAQLGDHDRALVHCGRSQELLAEHADGFGEATAWDSIGYIHHCRGDHRQALESYQRALALFREAEDQYYESSVLTHVGECHRDVGQTEQARSAWQQAVAILDRLDHSDGEAVRDMLASLDG